MGSEQWIPAREGADVDGKLLRQSEVVAPSFVKLQLARIAATHPVPTHIVVHP